MSVFITLLVLFLVLFSSACLYITVCIDLCALTPPVCGLSFISIKFCFVLESGVVNSLTTKKQTKNFSSATSSENVRSKLYHIVNSRTRGK